MTCASRRPAILDAAAGAPLPPAAADHLAACAECQQAFELEKQLLARIDQGLRETLAVEPSPALAARVRERAGRERARGPLSAMRWLLPALAALLALVAVSRVGRFSGRSPEPREASVPAREPLPAPPEPAAGLVASGPSQEPSTPRRAAAAPVTALQMRADPRTPAPGQPAPMKRPRTTAPALEPESLVPRDTEAALRRLVAGLRTRQVDSADLLVAELGVPPIEELHVAPLAIQPLSPD